MSIDSERPNNQATKRYMGREKEDKKTTLVISVNNIQSDNFPFYSISQ